MKRQATRATQEEVRRHIEAQRKHADLMAFDDDEPKWPEILATAIIAIAAAVVFFW